MMVSTVFTNNRTQAIRIPADLRFPSHVRHVSIRTQGVELIISPINQSWDSFFLESATVSDDFMKTRASQDSSDRETL